jgi:hypothetical protein
VLAKSQLMQEKSTYMTAMEEKSWSWKKLNEESHQFIFEYLLYDFSNHQKFRAVEKKISKFRLNIDYISLYLSFCWWLYVFYLNKFFFDCFQQISKKIKLTFKKKFNIKYVKMSDIKFPWVYRSLAR